MAYELIDICFNFTHAAFRADEAAVLERALKAGVTTMVVTGSSVEDSRNATELAARYPAHLFATAGVHPHHANTWTRDALIRLRELAAHPKVKAIGETGLDYNRNYSSPLEQRRAFEQQIELACELKLPLFLHLRDAHDEFMEILSCYRKDIRRAVVHCFTGNGKQLDACLAMDLHIGITGWICDERRGFHLRQLLERIPSDRLMIETDAPYLLPRDLEPKPKTRRNEPAFLPHVLAAVAAALAHPAGKVATATTATARRFYHLDDD
ncbi:MAG TPA: TatD family hydrolase [Gammaproteobacteria bacterium]|nr:TatD family hydrolase [Gammaproteobacteria bacterium]